MTIDGELRALAERVPAAGPSAVTLARQRAVAAAEAVTAALSTDPTLAERQQRWLDVLAELLRRLTPLARQASVAIESERLSAAGVSAAHLGRINPLAAEELDAISARCQELAAQVATAAWPDWNTPLRVRELSASRMPDEHELTEIAERLRRAVASALDLAHPDPEAVRLAKLATGQALAHLRELLARQGIEPGQEETARAIPVRAGPRRLQAGSRRGPRVVNRMVGDRITSGARTGQAPPGYRCKRRCKSGVSGNRTRTVLLQSRV